MKREAVGFFVTALSMKRRSGMFLFPVFKNQLTGNFFGPIMHSGIVLVLKWYFSLSLRMLMQGLKYSSARVRRHGARRWGTTWYLDAPGFWNLFQKWSWRR
jgi:hypothetical protein